MRALILTWEFPPFIAGGLGMACYGLSKALLAAGVEIDLMLPTSDDVYFPLRNPGDVDIMPVDFLDPARRKGFTVKTDSDVRERLRALGISAYPETYATPALGFEKTLEWLWRSYTLEYTQDIDVIRAFLRGEEEIFRKVKEFTMRAIRYARFLSCDLVHAHDWMTYPAGVILKKMFKKPLVAHIHATEFDRAGGVGDERIHKIEYMGLTFADLVIAVSQYTSQMVIDRYQINPNKIRVVHNAYSLSSEATYEKHKVFKDPLVLFLGRVTLQKGPDYFLEVAKRVLDQQPNVRFVMAGSGDMFSRIMRGAAVKRLRDRFLFAGFLNREQVEEILKATDIFVLPSVSEPFGIAPLEAMAFGAVAIVSRQSGVSEVIKNAYKVDFWDVDKTADIIIDLLGNPEKREAMARAGQEEVLSIGWQKAAEKAMAVYKELVCST